MRILMSFVALLGCVSAFAEDAQDSNSDRYKEPPYAKPAYGVNNPDDRIVTQHKKRRRTWPKDTAGSNPTGSGTTGSGSTGASTMPQGSGLGSSATSDE